MRVCWWWGGGSDGGGGAPCERRVRAAGATQSVVRATPRFRMAMYAHVQNSFVYRSFIRTTDEYFQTMCLLSTLHLPPPLLPCVFNREGKGAVAELRHYKLFNTQSKTSTSGIAAANGACTLEYPLASSPTTLLYGGTFVKLQATHSTPATVQQNLIRRETKPSVTQDRKRFSCPLRSDLSTLEQDDINKIKIARLREQEHVDQSISPLRLRKLL